MKKTLFLLGIATLLSCPTLTADTASTPSAIAPVPEGSPEGLPATSPQPACTSVNGKLSVAVKDSGYVVSFLQQPVLELTAVGMEGLKPRPANLSLEYVGQVSADYTMLAGKRLHCTNQASEYRAELGPGVALEMRLYNDGLAYRYELTGLDNQPLPKERTIYRIAEGTRRWIQQWTDAYEGFFPLTTSYKTKPVRSFSAVSTSPDGWNNRWGYPALIEPADGVFALLSEANIERQQSASCLYSDGELYRVTPDDNPCTVSGNWHSPWRVAIIGTLADIVASTLITDVSEPTKLDDTSWIHPGVVSWIYWAYNHGSNDYNIIKKYVDMAVTLKLPYVLIDAEWDTMKDGKTIEDAVAYAKSQGIRPMIWYNSSVGWVDGAPTPKYRLNKPEDREKEFAWCERIGVAGVKIDFFSGDNQRNMDYYHSPWLAAHLSPHALHRGCLRCRVVQQRAYVHQAGRCPQRHTALHTQRHRPHGLHPLHLQRLATPPHHLQRPRAGADGTLRERPAAPGRPSGELPVAARPSAGVPLHASRRLGRDALRWRLSRQERRPGPPQRQHLVCGRHQRHRQ